MKQNWLEDIESIYSEKSLTLFQKTLVVQGLRPDHLHTALTKFATNQLGELLIFFFIYEIRRVY